MKAEINICDGRWDECVLFSRIRANADGTLTVNVSLILQGPDGTQWEADRRDVRLYPNDRESRFVARQIALGRST